MVAPASRRGAGNLPVCAGSLVGRGDELSEVRQALQASHLVTLTGPGGVGKTRLGIEAARRVRRAFIDGVWAIELAGLTDGDLVAETVARSIGIPEVGPDGPGASLIDHLRGRRLLLLLDNCEHLLDACRALVEQILAAAPEVKVITTSRRALQLPGERVILVYPLEVSAPRETPPGAIVADADALQLLADRAQASQPGFRLTEENRPAAVELCRRLDGLPLAIELAATRLRSLSLQQLTERLEDRFGLLTLGSPAAMTRQQTLRALIDWSWDLCGEAERRLWAALSVFPGSFGLDAVLDVCVGPSTGVREETALDLLDELVAKSIVQAQTEGPRARYRLLETIRQYGAELPAAHVDPAEIRRSHRDHYLRLAQALQQRWGGPAQTEILRTLTDEYENFAAAIDWSIADPADEDGACRLAASLSHLWIEGGRLAAGRRHLEGALRSGARSRYRPHALEVAARVALLQGDVDAADAWMTESQTIAEPGTSPAPAAALQALSGARALVAGEPGKAAEHFRAAVTSARARDEPAVVVWGLFGYSVALAFGGCHEAGRRACDEAEQLARGSDDHCLGVYARWVRALGLWRAGDPDRSAERCVREGLSELPQTNAIATALGVELLAWVTAEAGDAEPAARILGEADALWRQLETSVVFLGPLFERPAAACRARVRAALGGRRYDALRQPRTVRLVADGHREAPRPTGEPSARATDLTPRERQVAELIAQGLTNRSIAQRLVLSPRTVDGHVGRLLTRIGASNRAQVAGWVARHETELHPPAARSAPAERGWRAIASRPAA